MIGDLRNLRGHMPDYLCLAEGQHCHLLFSILMLREYPDPFVAGAQGLVRKSITTIQLQRVL